jgi:DNA repair protein RecO (recombination protein O)
MIEKIEGIVVSELDYGETSKIINIVTPNHGIVGIMAKGAKTMKSELRSVTGKLTYGYFNVYYKKDKLSTLINVDVIDNLKNIRKNIDRISYATFILELAEQITKQHPSEDVYKLLVASLLKINESYDPMVITNILELKYLDFLGVMPIIDSCALCGSNTSISTLSSYSGGYVCNKCRTNEKLVDEKTIKLIRMFYYVDINKISKLDISDNVKKEINEFLDEYYDKYTGLYLKSKLFIKNLNKIV